MKSTNGFYVMCSHKYRMLNHIQMSGAPAKLHTPAFMKLY